MKLPKVKVSDFDANDKADAARIRARVEQKIKKYITSHPGCNVLDLLYKAVRPITTSAFVYDNVICTKCGHIEEKSSYAIAQRAQGHSVTFTCNCGNKINV